MHSPQFHGCLERRESFLVEAGAGAGKTYTLVKALHFLMDRYPTHSAEAAPENRVHNIHQCGEGRDRRPDGPEPAHL